MLRSSFLILFAIFLWAAQARAQQTVPLPVLDTAASDSGRVSPGKAFYRSLLVPGWGQASVGAYVRGGIFFGLQTSSAYMMLKTFARLGEAHNIESRRVGQAQDSLRLLMSEDSILNKRLSDRALFDAAVDSTPEVLRIRRLIRSRENQRQDWITYTLVWTLASGVDAFVAAHLATFPGRVEAEARPTGGMNLKVSFPTGRKP